MMSILCGRMPLIICVLLSAALVFSSAGMAQAAADGHYGWTKTDWARVLNFAILFAFLLYLFLKLGVPRLNDRISGIKSQLEDLEKQKQEAEKKLVEYNERLTRLDQETEEILAEYRKQGEDARARILEASKKAAEKLEEQARRSIEEEFSRAKKQLQGDVLEKALARAEDLLRARIGADDQQRLVNEYLDKVVAQ